MKHTREFEIAWQGLKPGIHTYNFEIDDSFLEGEDVDNSFRNWQANVKMNFDKHENFFMLHFDIDGRVTVPCDRCGDEFELRLWDEFELLIKLTGTEGEQPEEEDDVVFIPRNETVIDVKKWVYEFLILSVPIQKIHPDKPDGSSGCNASALQLLSKLSEQEVYYTNPIWAELDKKISGSSENN
jgi:uncharacterized metal-binding protein YceD (DUF177 family)